MCRTWQTQSKSEETRDTYILTIRMQYTPVRFKRRSLCADLPWIIVMCGLHTKSFLIITPSNLVDVTLSIVFSLIVIAGILVQWILTKACFAVWTMFYDWFWYYGVSRAEISRVPLWNPWAEFFKGKKMAARYFKVKYVFFNKWSQEQV